MSPAAITLLSVIGFIGLLMLLCVWQTRRIDITHIQYQSPLVPRELDGLTVVQVSDLHNRRFKDGPQQLIGMLRAQSPDIIAVTGDLIDRHQPDIEVAMDFIRLATDISPVYFVPGNHEFRSGCYDALLPRLSAAGVHVLEDTAETVKVKNGSFVIAGLRDPACFSDSKGRIRSGVLAGREAALRRLIPAGAPFTLLLSHRPELLSLYVRCGVPLVLTGHAHGGQIRLFGQGLYAPGQVVFPRYTSGLHRRGNTAMVVSRGLGGKEVRLRLFNRPELVVVKISK